ncbi:hypothetical protein Tco_0060201 [Tanacetum coccineum]
MGRMCQVKSIYRDLDPLVPTFGPRLTTGEGHAGGQLHLRRNYGWPPVFKMILFLDVASHCHAYVPHEGEDVVYFPHGHLEQIEASDQQLPAILLPPKILCKVVNVQLWVEEDIANTMDLPEKLLPRSSNRMGIHITTCNFKKSLGVVSRDH